MRYLIILFFLCSNINCFAQENYKKANDLYFNGGFTDLNSAINLYTKSINEEYQVFDCYVMRGAAKALLNQVDKSYSLQQAFDDLDKAYTINNRSNKCFFYYGKCYMFDLLYVKAIACYDTAILLDSSDALSYDARGNAYFFLGKIEQAINDVKTSIKIDSTDYSSYNDLGYFYSVLGKYDSALYLLNKSIRLKPCQKAYANRGIVYQLLGKFDSSILDFSNSLEISPKDREILYRRGQSYQFIGQKDKACLDFKSSSVLGYKEGIKKYEQDCN